MKQTTVTSVLSILKKSMVLFMIVITGFFLYSFTVTRFADDFLKELGISKTDADQKISLSILGGYLNAYEAKNAKNIVLGNRSAVTKDLLVYTKGYVQSAAFKKEYDLLKQRNKPKLQKVQTPEEVKNEQIAAIKKMIADSEAGLKKADATMKPIFEKVIVDGKKQLAQAEDPANKQHANYEKNYPKMVSYMEESNQASLKSWEEKYPANHMLFVKKRLEEFLLVTNDIDFNAELTTKNAKKVFVNPAYEKMDYRKKMAFRAGKEVVEPARAFVQQWVGEIK